MFFLFLSLFISVIILLVSVAFVTLLERKILAYRQRRVGPTKITLKGITQPLVDGVKLLHKRLVKPFNTAKDLLFLSPLILIIGIVIVYSCLYSIPYHRGL